ncbi:MAG: hypothetical protein HXS41_15670 [Theionarchaea archaeon]|nr:hypothetical protein [Theionarchaea archaeon]
MEKKSTGKVLIEIEEPCIMDLVNPDEREQLRKRIIEKIRPDVVDLLVSETERLLKECYSLSSEDLAEGEILLEPGLSEKVVVSIAQRHEGLLYV